VVTPTQGGSTSSLPVVLTLALAMVQLVLLVA